MAGQGSSKKLKQYIRRYFALFKNRIFINLFHPHNIHGRQDYLVQGKFARKGVYGAQARPLIIIIHWSNRFNKAEILPH